MPVIGDQSVAACTKNADWLERCWKQGVEAKLPNGTLYIRRTAQTPITTSCGTVIAATPGGYWIPSDHPTLCNWTDNNGKRHPLGSRIVQLTPEIPAILVRGSHFRVKNYPIIEGQGSAEAIQIEGRAVGVATSHHRLEFNAYNWLRGVRCLGGYYDEDGDFIEQEEQAADSRLSGIFQATDSIIRLENQQSVNWKLDCVYSSCRPGGTARIIDCQRGGSLTADITVTTTPVTVLRIADYSDNQCNFDLKLWFDGMSGAIANFTLVELGNPDCWWAPWFIKMRGWIAQQRYGGVNRTATCTHYNVPENMNRTKWDIAFDFVE